MQLSAAWHHCKEPSQASAGTKCSCAGRDGKREAQSYTASAQGIALASRRSTSAIQGRCHHSQSLVNTSTTISGIYLQRAQANTLASVNDAEPPCHPQNE